MITLEKVKVALKQQDKVAAMKIVISATRCGLAEAKDYVDSLIPDA
ncbi:hypothetical protein BH23PAT2_BH23PAT2_06930 [soil metagenome]